MRQQPLRQLDARDTSRKAAWATSWKTSSTGAFSRERYWGTPLPVWTLRTAAMSTWWAPSRSCAEHGREGRPGTDIELHKPYHRSKCTSALRKVRRARCTRVREVIDCWFDSGSMPFAQWHYPFENKEEFEQQLPGRLHLRGHRPDPRLVLYPAGHLDAAVRQARPLKTASSWAMCRIRTAAR